MNYESPDVSASEQAEADSLAKRYPHDWSERNAAKLERQLRLKAFAHEHGLACFKCGTRMNDWAKTGVTNRRAWAICVQCVRRKRAS